jgi:hypothetical protein
MSVIACPSSALEDPTNERGEQTRTDDPTCATAGISSEHFFAIAKKCVSFPRKKQSTTSHE